jgi:hypothetical protein
MEKARALLLESHSQQIANYTGSEFGQVMAQIARENELKESLGLMPSIEQPPEPVAPPPDAEEDDDEDEDAPEDVE